MGDPFHKDKWEALATEGRLLANCTAADGGVVFEIVVGEPPPEDLVQRGKSLLKGALLRIPSGELRICGAEHLIPEASGEPKRPYLEGCIHVPPGDYLVDVYQTSFPEDEAEGFDEEVISKVGQRTYRVYDWVAHGGCAAYVLLLICTGVSLPIAWHEGGGRGLFTILGYCLAMFALVRFIRWVVLGRPRMMELARILEQRAERMEGMYPDELVVLRRLRDGTDISGLMGAKYGTGA